MGHQAPGNDQGEDRHWGKKENDPSIVPFDVQVALRKAMALERVPPAHFPDYLWMIAQESEGKVNARNSTTTARGLFQLERAVYGMNPRGTQSFGNAVEECQGGIRYIQQRYQSLQAAKHHWKQRPWF